jgi:hypothetical protein
MIGFFQVILVQLEVFAPANGLNPVIRGCILLQLAFFQETLRQTNLRIEGEIEDLERERR